MSKYWSALVGELSPYVPGEQPQGRRFVKLNTNENPYPPSPRVLEALERVIRDRLNLYPDPLGTKFREAVAKLFQLDPDWVLPANGSDENLTILMRCFINPDDLVVYPYPSYILYETLVDLRDREIQLRYDRHRQDASAVIVYHKGQRQGPARLLDAVANGLRRRKEQA